MARLWDVLGFVAPVILYAKLLIKQLWLSRVDWDEEPPKEIIDAWNQFCAELALLNQFKIPRYLGASDDKLLTIIGFADASEKAYGGVVYLHTSTNNENIAQLVCAKSKVSPTKKVSVARLELLAAVLL